MRLKPVIKGIGRQATLRSNFVVRTLVAMSKFFKALMATFLVSGCVILAKNDYCVLSPEQQKVVASNIEKAIDKISNEDITYYMPALLVKKSKLYRDETGCWAYLLPKSLKEGHSILDGDGGIYVNVETLEVGDVFWFQY